MRIEILGPMAPKDRMWCFTCMAQYMGTLTQSDEWQASVKERVAEAEKAGKAVALIAIAGPEVTGGRLNVAETIGTSYWAPGAPTPVCWSHIQGIKPDEALYAEAEERRKQIVNQSGLIPGKKFEVPR